MLRETSKTLSLCRTGLALLFPRDAWPVVYYCTEECVLHPGWGQQAVLVVLSWRLNLTGRCQLKALSYIWFKTWVIITFPSTKNKGKAGFERLGVKQRSIKCSGQVTQSQAFLHHLFGHQENCVKSWGSDMAYRLQDSILSPFDISVFKNIFYLQTWTE